MPVIYKLTCKTSGKSYIGQTIYTAELRWKRHKKDAKANGAKQCTAINRAIRLYGETDFEIATLIECSREELDAHEVRLIEEHGTLCPNGYNICKGGAQVRVDPSTWSDEVKDKVSMTLRKNTTYDLPRGVSHVVRKDRGTEGFQVTLNDKTYTFMAKHLTIEEKMKMALECYETVKSGNEYIFINKHKKHHFETDIPKYVLKKGIYGYSVQKPGCQKRVFAGKKKTLEENLQLAINYLNTLQ